MNEIKETKSKRIFCRITPTEYSYLKKIAKENKQTISDYLRSKIWN
jgi:uncharacterized protein (DUF1778 family)